MRPASFNGHFYEKQKSLVLANSGQLKKIEYLDNEKSIFGDIKSIFYIF